MKAKSFGQNLIGTAALLVVLTLGSDTEATPGQVLSARNPAVPLPAGANDNSAAPVLSSNGRFVVFTSAANDLIPGGSRQPFLNVYLRDRNLDTTVLVSVRAGGTGGGNGHSTPGQASAYGRYVVFQSEASDLVPGDTNGVSDIFLRDTYTSTTRLISVAANGGFASGASTDPVMTPDGTCVAFISAATNLVAGDTNGIADVFVRDLITQTTWLVSVNARLPANPTNPIVATPVITPDGRCVAFFSSAMNLVPAVPAASPGEVYVRDRVAGTTAWASTNAAAIVSATLGLANVPAYHPRLSDDGRYVAFKAGATLPNGAAVILVYDTTTGTTAVANTNGVGWYLSYDDCYGPEMTPDGRYLALVQHEGSLNPTNSSVHVWDTQGAVDTLASDSGGGVPTNTTSFMPVISSDGRFVVFLSDATNLTGNAVSNGFHIYRRDLELGSAQLVDADTNGIGTTDDAVTSLSLSADGRHVAFSSPDGRLVGSDQNQADDVFVRDAVGGATEIISRREATMIPEAGDGFTALGPRSVSADGRWAAFASAADDLVLNDTNRQPDVFVRDLINGTNRLVSIGWDGNPALGGGSGNPVISADGRYVAFISGATNLVAGPANTNANVFRRDLQTGTTTLVSVGTDGVGPGNNDASDLVISSNGQYIAFLSQATNLAAGGAGGSKTYWRDMTSGQTMGFITNNTGSVFSPFAPSLSSNGRYVAYVNYLSSAARLQIRDTQLGKEIYTNAGAVTSAAIDPTGTKIVYRMTNALYVDVVATRSNLFTIPTLAPIRNAGCWSEDGRWLTFVSTTNLTGGDNGTNKIYLKDFQTGTLTLVGLAGPGTGTTAGLSDGPVVSGNGRFVAYRSVVTNTMIGDSSVPPNLCLLDRLTGSNLVLNIVQNSSVPLLWASRPVISSDGATVAFLNLDSGLADGDFNRVPDAFGASLDVNAALVDSDSDGIPDWWMIKYFGHATGQAGDLSRTSDDADGDSVTNLQEYLAGTNPIDINSVFRLWAGASADSKLTLTWPAMAGKSYQVQSKTNLTDSVWLTVPGSAWVTGGWGYYLVPMAQPLNFYRVLATD
jgi:Tol biopolymer transport system component